MSGARRALIVTISLAFILFFRFLPAPAGMTQEAMQVLGIFAGVLILWMTISIDWPSMLCILAISFVPGMKMSSVLAGSVGNATFSFLLFTFMCTYTLSQTPFIRRCAIGFITNRVARKGPWYFVVLYFTSVLVLGSFMSPTVLVIVFLTIAEEIYAVLGLQKGSKVGNMIMMGTVFCAGISSGMTPIAHVFPLLSLGVYESATGQAVSYASYMMTGIPVGLLTAVLMLLLFRFVLRPNMAEIKSLDTSHLKQELKPMDRREGMCIAVFFLVVALWVLPGLLKSVLPGFYTYINGFGTAMPPLLGAVLMAIITCDGKPLLDFNAATTKGIPWASVIMTAGTLSLAAAITDENIGLTTWISDRISPFATGLAPMALVALFVFWAAVQTNLSSNMVTATVVATIALPITMATAGAVNSAAVIALIGMMASYAFATPPAMATVVFAIGSGWTTTGSMARYGSAVMLIGVVAATLVGYPIAMSLM